VLFKKINSLQILFLTDNYSAEAIGAVQAAQAAGIEVKF
jgi:hypothetical protein